MALYTTDYLIRPEDGWTKVATNPGELIIKPAVYHPWWVAITDSGTPAVTVVGVPMGRDPSNRNEDYHLVDGVTGEVYIRIATPTDSDSFEKMAFNVTIGAVGGLAGGATAANQTTMITDLGSVTETAPTTDTASSGLNGRLQRIAQRLTSLIVLLPTSLGSKAASSSLSVTQAGYEYETVAASQTAQVLGATGATGDFLSHIIFQPLTTAAGTSTILDNATVIYTFTTGTLSDLRPITVPINAFSVSGAWKVTTGANITATGFGDFT